MILFRWRDHIQMRWSHPDERIISRWDDHIQMRRSYPDEMITLRWDNHILMRRSKKLGPSPHWLSNLLCFVQNTSSLYRHPPPSCPKVYVVINHVFSEIKRLLCHKWYAAFSIVLTRANAARGQTWLEHRPKPSSHACASNSSSKRWGKSQTGITECTE